MMKRLIVTVVLMSMVLGGVFAAGQAEPAGPGSAPAFPAREVRLIVPYNPGGQSDVMARQISSVIERNRLMNQPVVVTNVAGAGTRDGLRAVQDSRPDGHTVLFHHSAMLTLSSLDLIPWKVEDFTVIAQMAQAPMVVVTRDASPHNSINDLVAAARQRPGEIPMAIQGGLGSNAHFISEMVADGAGVEFRRVVYPGGAEARAAILGGHAEWYVTSLTESVSLVQSGDFKILGISSAERVAGLDDVPTLVEQGYDIVFNIHSSIFAPKNLPQPVRMQWENVLRQVAADSEYQAFMQSNFTQPLFLSGREAEAAYADQWARIQVVAEVVKAAAEQQRQ